MLPQVWLHGGGFTSGNGSYTIYDGTNLARRQDVVMVTINHRLNSFGFTYIDGQAANVGMLDCIAALEWVRDNISRFGGDVVILGNGNIVSVVQDNTHLHNVVKPSANPLSLNRASCMHGPLAPKGASSTSSRLRST